MRKKCPLNWGRALSGRVASIRTFLQLGGLGMSIERFTKRIQSIDELTDLVGLPGELVIKKQLSQLDEFMKSFIAQAPFVLLGTVDSNGNCDVSPRGDTPNVAKVLDEKTLVIADRPGNRRADSLRNIVDTGRVGLLFLVPGLGETLRINGRACVLQDANILALLTVDGRQPIVGIGVEVEECFLQCAKALIRSDLWHNRPRHPDATSERFAEILIKQTGIEDETVESLAAQIAEAYRSKLY
jgi:uncharacterized protein